MSEIWLSVGVSGALVILEALGIFVSRWNVMKWRLTQIRAEASANAAAQFDSAAMLDGTRPAQALVEVITNAAEDAQRKEMVSVAAAVAPGPEACFLSLTLVVSIFLAFSYAGPDEQASLSPTLATSSHPYPYLLLLLVLFVSLWILSLTLREAIIGWAFRGRKSIVASVAVTLMGGVSLALVLHSVLAGR